MQILVLFLIGAVLTIVGVLLKIAAFKIASLPLILGIVFEGAAVMFLLLKVLKKDKPGSFRDS